MPAFGEKFDSGTINDIVEFLVTGHDIAEKVGKDPTLLKYRNNGYDIFLDQDGYPAVSHRGSTHVISPNQLAIWTRNPNDGLATGIAANPKVTVAFFDPTSEAIKAGRPFLYDTHLGSGNGHISCASCHDPRRAFADTRRVAVGVDNRSGRRNAPALINRGYGRAFFWDARAESLARSGPARVPDRSGTSTA